MTEHKDGGPAFPLIADAGAEKINTGMTLWDYFAAHALSAAIQNDEWTNKESAEWAAECADYLLSERESRFK